MFVRLSLWLSLPSRFASVSRYEEILSPSVALSPSVCLSACLCCLVFASLITQKCSLLPFFLSYISLFPSLCLCLSVCLSATFSLSLSLLPQSVSLGLFLSVCFCMSVSSYSFSGLFCLSCFSPSLSVCRSFSLGDGERNDQCFARGGLHVGAFLLCCYLHVSGMQ